MDRLEAILSELDRARALVAIADQSEARLGWTGPRPSGAREELRCARAVLVRLGAGRATAPCGTAGGGHDVAQLRALLAAQDREIAALRALLAGAGGGRYRSRSPP